MKRIIIFVLIIASLLLLRPAAFAEDFNFCSGTIQRELFEECDRPGELKHISYLSYNYEEQKRNLKQMTLYLPYGYSKDQKYNVIFMMPGTYFSEKHLLYGTHPYRSMEVSLKIMVDNMIDQGICEPCILCCPSYYGGTKSKGESLARDTEQLSNEIRDYIIPYLIKYYSVYGDLNDLPSGRAHYAYCGYSYGSMHLYCSILRCNYDLIGWYGSWSGNGFPVEYYNKMMNETDYPCYYFYANYGDTCDSMSYETGEGFRDLIKTTNKLVLDKNCYLARIKNSSHNWELIYNGLYDCLRIFFQEKYIQVN